MKNTSSNLPVVTINETEIQPIEYDNQRVVTFAMIDKVHGRTAGTASRNFKANRSKLIQDEDYFHLSQQVMKSLDEFRPTANPNGIFVLTESGYLLLVKSFTDDLAWQVQRQLVRAYFKGSSERSVEPNKTITPTEQHGISLAVKTKAGNNHKAIPEIWSRVHNKFKVAKYTQIPSEKFYDVVEYILDMELRTVQATPTLDIEIATLKEKIIRLEESNRHLETVSSTYLSLYRDLIGITVDLAKSRQSLRS